LDTWEVDRAGDRLRGLRRHLVGDGVVGPPTEWAAAVKATLVIVGFWILLLACWALVLWIIVPPMGQWAVSHVCR
jgi:hypothetical protein